LFKRLSQGEDTLWKDLPSSGKKLNKENTNSASSSGFDDWCQAPPESNPRKFGTALAVWVGMIPALNDILSKLDYKFGSFSGQESAEKSTQNNLNLLEIPKPKPSTESELFLETDFQKLKSSIDIEEPTNSPVPYGIKTVRNTAANKNGVLRDNLEKTRIISLTRKKSPLLSRTFLEGPLGGQRHADDKPIPLPNSIKVTKNQNRLIKGGDSNSPPSGKSG
jgi:hypothetical protein